MELELKMRELIGCEKTQCVVISHEEVMETAIPEYCPDIARVVDAVGQLKIREKKLSNGRLSIGGIVKMTVLYTSESGTGLRSLVLPIPFSCVVDDQLLNGCRSICACGRLQLVEARAVTARKLYVRVMPEFEVEGIRDKKYTLCVAAGDDPSIHVHRNEKDVHLLADVLERNFTINQECVPPAGKGRPEDLLLERVYLRATDCQRMGAKLIIKGEATVSVLYRTEDQELCAYEEALPFSQIIDGAKLPEEAAYQTELWAEDTDVRLMRVENSAGFGVMIRVGVMVKVYEKTAVQYIDDLYSTEYETTLQHTTQQLAMDSPSQCWRQEAVQQLEFGQGRPFACVTGMECSCVHTAPEGDRTALYTNLRVKLLYLDEAGSPVSTERTMEVCVHMPQLPDHARANCAPVVMNLGGNRCELRIPVDFFTEQTEHLQIETMVSAEMQESAQKEMPALVLRRISEGDSLWNIAKTYRTDPLLIEKVNGLEQGTLLPQSMVLIPKAHA